MPGKRGGKPMPIEAKKKIFPKDHPVNQKPPKGAGD